MKVTEHIATATDTLFSFEVVPPVKGRNIEELYRNIDPLMEFRPPFIDVTTSREEYVYVDRDGKVVRDPKPGPCGTHGPLNDFLVTIRNPDHPADWTPELYVMTRKAR